MPFVLLFTLMLVPSAIVAESITPPRVSPLFTKVQREVVIDPYHKLLVCAIEKCGTVTTRGLVATLFKLGTESESLAEASGWSKEALATLKENHFQPHRMWNMGQYDAVLSDPSWSKFMFYRDPLLRFLSGWASKCTDGFDADRGHCVQAFGGENVPVDKAIMNLKRWASIPWKLNVHWMPQVYFCGGLSRHTNYTRVLLNRESTATLSDFVYKKMNVSDPQGQLSNLLKKREPGSQPSGHNTKASDSILDQFPNAAELKAIIRDFYKEDYALLAHWGITPPV